MKNSVVVCFSLLLLSACSTNLGNAEGSTDLGSLSGDFTYHDLYQGVNSNSQSFTFYQKIQLRTSDSGFVFDASKNDGGIKTVCKIEGTWILEDGNTTASQVNELVVTTTAINGSATVKTIRYPLNNLSDTKLSLQLSSATTQVTDLINVDLADYQAPDTTGATNDTFCEY